MQGNAAGQTTVQVEVTQPGVSISTNNDSYQHRQHGNFYFWYHIMAVFFACIFVWMMIDFARSGVGFVHFIFPVVWFMTAISMAICLAASSKYLEIRDEGNKLIIEFGPFKNPVLCGITKTTIDYDEITEFAPVGTGCLTHCIRYVNYDNQKSIKFMMHGNMCDCCGGNINYQIYQITLRKARCKQYRKIRFTTDDAPALIEILKAKGVNVIDDEVKPCCGF